MRFDRSVVGTVLRRTPVGVHPVALALDERAGHLFVACRGNFNENGEVRGSVAMLDAQTGEILRTLSDGVEFQAIAVDERTGYVFAADRGPVDDYDSPLDVGSVLMIESTTGALLKQVPVGKGPRHIGIDARCERVVVANEEDNTISFLDAHTGALIRTVAVRIAPVRVVIARETGRTFVLNLSNRCTISLLDTATGDILREIRLSDSVTDLTVLTGLMVDEVHHRVLVTDGTKRQLHVLDARDGELISSVSVPAYPLAVTYDSLRDRAFVLLNAHALTVPVEQVCIVDLGADGHGHLLPWTVSVGRNPSAITVDETRRYVYVANNGNGTLTILDADAANPNEMFVKSVPLGDMPWPGVVVVAQRTARVFAITDKWSREIQHNGEIFMLHAGGERPATST